jgi:hypothetical protein
MSFFKLMGSLFVGLLGSTFLYQGKKHQSVKMMLWGGVLIILSYFLF